MNEPIKKRLIGAVVIAAVGGLALSFVLHDSHPTYSQPSGSTYAEASRLATSPENKNEFSAANHDSNTHVLILPKKQDNFHEKNARDSAPNALLATGAAQPDHGTCHYRPKSKTTDCDEEKQSDSISATHSVQDSQSSDELKSLVSLSKPVNADPAAQADQLKQALPAELPLKRSEPKAAPKPLAQKQVLVAPEQGGHYSLRIATFKSKANATRLAQRLRAQDLPAHLTLAHAGGTTYYRVVIGPANQGLVNKWKTDLALTEHLQGYVVKK